MGKMSLKKIYITLFYVLSKNKRVDNILLKINDKNNRLLKVLSTHSYELRAALYGEGDIRLSNDPDINVNYRWPVDGNIIWAEVPCFSIQAMLPFKEKNILELGCANGWYYREFYSNLNNVNYIGCDLSEETIKEANVKLAIKEKKNKKSYNAHFMVADMCLDMPKSNKGFTNVLWFASMCMFTKEQRSRIFLQIVDRLDGEKGILSGSGVVRDKNRKQWGYYIGLLDSEEALREELAEYFENIYISKNSTNDVLFFMASNGTLPCYNEK